MSIIPKRDDSKLFEAIFKAADQKIEEKPAPELNEKSIEVVQESLGSTPTAHQDIWEQAGEEHESRMKAVKNTLTKKGW